MYRILLLCGMMLLLASCVCPFTRQPAYTETTETLFIEEAAPDPIKNPLGVDGATTSVQ